MLGEIWYENKYFVNQEPETYRSVSAAARVTLLFGVDRAP